MKNYKEFKQIYIGYSDIASLTVRSVDKVGVIDFGGDSSYRAYLCEGDDVEIGSHYKPVFEGEYWIAIYDDSELTVKLYGKRITVYRAGDYGCIIHVEK